MARIKRCRSMEKERINDATQASDVRVKKSKKSKVKIDRASIVRSGAIGNSAAQTSNSLEGHKIPSIDNKECQNEDGAKFFDPSDFVVGNLVWAKCSGKKFPTWPGIVIDPSCAPTTVRKSFVSNALCVMFFGTRNGQREYGWIKAGMVFPFDSYMDRFKGQTKLYGNRLSDFSAAINEALGQNEGTEYYLQPLSESNRLRAGSTNQALLPSNLSRNLVPHKMVSVVCNSVQGIYDSALKLVCCSCASCDNAKKYTLSAWEKHTGSKAKKWKISIRLHDSRLTLSHWMLIHVMTDAQKLYAISKENSKQVQVRWTAERCAVCRCIGDSDSNKMIICHSCCMAVHQECYGAMGCESFSSWVCQGCETPEVKRPVCCLCPVVGGALKPTDIEHFWVHVTCAWFAQEISLSTEACVICKLVHGSCIQCSKCTTHFHATCASRAGYYLEIHCIEKNGIQIITNWISYCAAHRTPSADNALVITTPGMIFSDQRDNHGQHSNASITITTKHSDSPSAIGYEYEEMSAARCRIYNRPSRKEVRKDAVIHRLMGPIRHSLDAIRSLNLHSLDAIRSSNLHKHDDKEVDTRSLRERLEDVKIMQRYHVCFGKSRIHGWGIFARRNILNGQMIIEYNGEVVRTSIADVREVRSRSHGGDDYYLYKITKEIIIDATNKGNISRLLNHSCMPNCCARVVSVEKEDSRIILIAISDISADEELTCDYMYGDPDGCDEGPCMCNTPKCKKPAMN